MAEFYTDDEDGRMEYYYDLVLRTPELEAILIQLRSSRAVKAWKMSRSSRMLSFYEIEMLTDANIVDWSS